MGKSGTKAPAKKPPTKKKAKVAPKKKEVGANARKWGQATHAQGWTYVPNLLLEHQAELGISPIELNIILVLMKHWWEPDNLPWPKVNTIAEAIGRSRSVVQRRIRDLEERGFVRRVFRKDPRKEKMNLANEYDFAGLVAAVAKIAKRREKEKKK